MKYNEINQPNPSQPDTQNTGMAQNQLLKIGQHAIKIENMIADNQEISEWANNKIDLATDYIKKIHNKYLKEFDNPREKTNVRPVTTMDPKELGDRIEKAKAKVTRKPSPMDITKLWAKEKPTTEVAPPGREKQVKALKGKVDNPYAVAWASYNKSKGKKEDAMTSVDVDRVKGQEFSDKQIKMAYGVLNDPRFKDNYSGAYNVINKIAPGLADHPSVAKALQRANEAGYPDLKVSGRDKMIFHGKEINQDSIEYEMQDASDMIFELHGAKFVDGTELNDEELQELESTDELQDWVRIDHATSGPDAPDDYPFGEGFIGKRPEYNDFLQNKLDQAIQEYDTPEKKAERDALMQKYLNKGGKIEKVPTGKTAYKNKELKPAYRKDNGTPITSPGSDESVQEALTPGRRKLKMAMAQIENVLNRIDETAFNSSEEMQEFTNFKDEVTRLNNMLAGKLEDAEPSPGFAVRYSLDGERKIQS